MLTSCLFKYIVPHNSRDTLLLPFLCISIVEVLVLWLYKFTGPACPHFMNNVCAYVCVCVCFFCGGGGGVFARIVFVNHSHGHIFFSTHDVLFFEALVTSSEQD